MSDRRKPVAGGALSDEDRLILDAANGTRHLSTPEIGRVLQHVAQAGFDPTIYRGRTAAERHFAKHVITRQEWPAGTTLRRYLESIRQVILDPKSGLFTSRYYGAEQLGMVRAAEDIRGPRGFDYLLVEYRVSLGRWVTAHQLERGLAEIPGPQRTEVRWLRALR